MVALMHPAINCVSAQQISRGNVIMLFFSALFSKHSNVNFAIQLPVMACTGRCSSDGWFCCPRKRNVRSQRIENERWYCSWPQISRVVALVTSIEWGIHRGVCG